MTKVSFGSTVFGDIDNDGRLDLVLTGHYTNNIAKVYINNGTTLIENFTWEQNLTAVNYGSLALGDIDNDGDLDLALSGCSNGGNGLVASCNDGGYQTFIYINNGTSFIESNQWQNNLTKSWKGSLALGDINSDGTLDLALTGQSSTGKISKIYINNGTSLIENSQWQNNLTAVYESALAFGDINNDGTLDLALCGDAGISNEISKIYINNATSLIEDLIWEQNLLSVDWCSLAFGDYDNNGDLDLSLIGHTNHDNHEIYNNTGTSLEILQSEETGTGSLIGIYAGSLAFGDYDNDGDLDLVTTGNEGYSTLYLYNISSSNFTTYSQDPENLADLDYGSTIVWGDLNNDNSLDVIETGANSIPEDDVYVYLSNRSLTKNNTLPTPPSILLSFYSVANNTLILGWNNGSDNETLSMGLYYNLMIGNSTNNHSIVSGVYGGSSNPTAGYFGNMMQRKNITLNLILPAGTYYWYVQTIDTGLAKGNWSARQSFTVNADSIAPSISSVSNSSITSSSAVITWSTDEMANSTVYYGLTIGTTSSSRDASWTRSHSISLSGLSASTLYYYNVSSCDDSGNCNTSQQYSFTTANATQSENPPSGGGGSSSTTTSFWTKTETVNDANFSAGVEKELSAKQRLSVNVAGESHYIGVINVDNSTGKVTINISSNPIQIVLRVGEERKVDISNDSWYDIYLRLISILNNKVNLTIRAIHEQVSSGIQNQSEISGEEIPSGEEEAKKCDDWLWIGIGIAFVLIADGIVFYLLKRKGKEGKMGKDERKDKRILKKEMRKLRRYKKWQS